MKNDGKKDTSRDAEDREDSAQKPTDTTANETDPGIIIAPGKGGDNPPPPPPPGAGEGGS